MWFKSKRIAELEREILDLKNRSLKVETLLRDILEDQINELTKRQKKSKKVKSKVKKSK